MRKLEGRKILLFCLLTLSMVLTFVSLPALAAEGDVCAVTADCTGVYKDGVCTVCGKTSNTFTGEADRNLTAVPMYKVNIGQFEKGSVAAGQTSVSEGTTVTLTAAANQHCQLVENSLTVTDTKGNPVAVTKGDAATFTFTMPASDVTVSAAFEGQTYGISYWWRTSEEGYAYTHGALPDSYVYGQGVKLADDIVPVGEHLAGYEFVGWSNYMAEEKSIIMEIGPDVFGSVTLTPVFHKHDYTYTKATNSITASCSGSCIDAFQDHDGQPVYRPHPDSAVTLSAPASLVYDGSAKDAVLTYSAWSLGEHAKPVVSYTGPEDRTNVTGKEITASIALGTETACVSYTISKAPITVTVALESWTYGESAKTPSVTGNAGNGAVTYTYYTDAACTIPTDGVPVNAGTYYVKAAVAETDNYPAADATVSFAIAPRQITNPTIEGIEEMYLHTGEEIKPLPTAVKDGDICIPGTEYTVEWENNLASGTATLKIVDAPDGNYTVSGSKTFGITTHHHVWSYGVNADGNSIAATCIGTLGTCPNTNGGTLTIVKPALTVYGGTESREATLTASEDSVFDPETLTIHYRIKDGADLTAAPTNAGNYIATVTLGEGEAAVTASAEYTIAKATPQVTAPTAKTLTYNRTAQALIHAASCDNGSVHYSLDGITYTTEIPVGTNAGTYTVYYKVTGNDNYADVAAQTVRATISPKSLNHADISITVTDSVVFVGERVPLVVKDGTVELSWNRDFTMEQTSSNRVYTMTITGAGNSCDKATSTPSCLVVSLPDPKDVKPDDKTAITEYERYTKLNETYKDDTLKEELEALHKALTAYDITEQSAKSYVKGSYKNLKFTANGYYEKDYNETTKAYGKFVSLAVDDEIVDPKYYDLEKGSTIITLKYGYLESLKTGKHTIQVNYTDGSTDGEDTFRVSVNNGNPITGDDSHLLFFAGMSAASLLGMVIMAMYLFRRKRKFEG